jgi:glutathione S-transferase
VFSTGDVATVILREKEMAMLKIWGRDNSSNVAKVLWVCEELGLPFERIDLGGKFGGDKEPPYLAKNPNGLIPTIEDGDLVLWESNTILRYLAAKYPGAPTLLPADLGARADMERWMDWQLSVLAVPMSAMFWNLIRLAPEQRDMAAVEAARHKAASAWATLDRHLADRAYVGGAHFTIGDIPVGIMGWRWLNLPIERANLPHLAGWVERLKARAGYRKYVALPLN